MSLLTRPYQINSMMPSSKMSKETRNISKRDFEKFDGEGLVGALPPS